jgi:hypothetical protein
MTERDEAMPDCDDAGRHARKLELFGFLLGLFLFD